MSTLDLLGDPVRRRIAELLAGGDKRASGLSRIVEAEFDISQPAVARHLRLLREGGVVEVRSEGAARIYSLRPRVIDELESLARRYRALWSQRLDALETEIARGRRARAATTTDSATTTTTPNRTRAS